MKKLLLVAALGVAGLMSANTSFEVSPRGGWLSWNVTFTDCSGNIIEDTLGWQEGNMESYYDMLNCEAELSYFWSEYNCPN